MLFIYRSGGNNTNNRYIGIGVVITLLFAAVGIVGLPQALAKKGAYEAGSAHAAADCQAGTQKYLDSPGKGPAFHTNDFNQGYME
jgi:hypothetical protein